MRKEVCKRLAQQDLTVWAVGGPVEGVANRLLLTGGGTGTHCRQEPQRQGEGHGGHNFR